MMHMQVQQSRVEHFCERYHQGGPDYTVNLGIHILTDDNSKIAYCFAPKVGCTHLKVAFFRAQGMKPHSFMLKFFHHHKVVDPKSIMNIQEREFIFLTFSKLQNFLKLAFYAPGVGGWNKFLVVVEVALTFKC